MLERLGATVKGILTRRLTYSDIYALVEPSLRNPAPLDFLTDSAELSWAAVTSGESGSFQEHWRTVRLDPILRTISEQPTHGLQCDALRGVLLDAAAASKWAGLVMKLSYEDASEFLRLYPSPSASAMSVDWKLEHVSLELALASLNSAALLQLGRRGFGINQTAFEAWLDLYAEAYGQLVAQAALVGANSPMPDNGPASDALHNDLISSTVATLALMREGIARGKADIEETAARYEHLVAATRALLSATE